MHHLAVDSPRSAAHPQNAPGPLMRPIPEAQLSGAMQLSLTRHKELLGGHTEMPTVIGHGPLVPQGLRIMCWQQGRAKEGSRP